MTSNEQLHEDLTAGITVPGLPLRLRAGLLTVIIAFLRKWITDGWLTQGEQIGCLPGQVRVFMRCVECQAVYPHWFATMTAAEVKRRGKLGCDRCGGLRLTPTRLSAWRSFYWFAIRGWLIRHVMLKRRIWDPRMVAMERELR